MCNHQPNLTNLQVLPTNAATPTEAIDHGDHKNRTILCQEPPRTMAPRALFTVAPPNSPWETTAGASNSPALASASELDPKNLCNPAAFQGLQRLQGPAHSWLSNQAKHSKTGDYYMPITECKDPTNTAGGNNLEARGSSISSSFAQEAVGSDPHTSRCEQNPLQALHCIALVAAAILTS